MAFRGNVLGYERYTTVYNYTKEHGEVSIDKVVKDTSIPRSVVWRILVNGKDFKESRRQPRGGHGPAVRYFVALPPMVADDPPVFTKEERRLLKVREAFEKPKELWADYRALHAIDETPGMNTVEVLAAMGYSPGVHPEVRAKLKNLPGVFIQRKGNNLLYYTQEDAAYLGIDK